MPDGTLKYRNRVYVPNGAAICAEILRKNHDDPHAGHFGTQKTLELLQRKYWPKMANDVQDYVRNCEGCNCTKAARYKPYGLLQSLPVPEGPWQDIIMNFIRGMPSSLGRDGKAYGSILAIVDRFTKLAKYYPVLKTITAEQMGDLLVQTIYCSFGTPKSVVSNRG